MSAAVEVQQDDSCIAFRISEDPVQLNSHPEFQLQAARNFIRTGLTRLYSNAPEMIMRVRITVVVQEEKDFLYWYTVLKYNRILHIYKIVIIFFNLLWNVECLSHLKMEQISYQYNSISGRNSSEQFTGKPVSKVTGIEKLSRFYLMLSLGHLRLDFYMLELSTNIVLNIYFVFFSSDLNFFTSQNHFYQCRLRFLYYSPHHTGLNLREKITHWTPFTPVLNVIHL